MAKLIAKINSITDVDEHYNELIEMTNILIALPEKE